MTYLLDNNGLKVKLNLFNTKIVHFYKYLGSFVSSLFTRFEYKNRAFSDSCVYTLTPFLMQQGQTVLRIEVIDKLVKPQNFFKKFSSSFSDFFFELQKSSFFLSGPAFPPPLFVVLPLKKKNLRLH